MNKKNKNYIQNGVGNKNVYEKYKDDNLLLFNILEMKILFLIFWRNYKNKNKHIYFNIPSKLVFQILLLILFWSINQGEFKDIWNRWIYFQKNINDIPNNFHYEEIKKEIIGIYDIRIFHIKKDIIVLFVRWKRCKYNNKEN